MFFGVYLLNSLTLYTSDDFIYHFFYRGDLPPSGDLRLIKSIPDLVDSQINHWQTWNGRFVAHTLVQIFMQFDKSIFNFLNSLAFVGLGLLIAHFSNKITRSSKLNPLILISSYLLLWWTLPEFGKTVLWLSGSANYLWTSIFYLTWFYAILFWRSNFITCLPLVILGFLAGATNENSAPAIILSCFLYLIYSLFVNKTINLAKWLSLLSAAVGFYLILKSPGSQARAGENVMDLFDISCNLIEVLRLQRFYFVPIYVAIVAFAISLRHKMRRCSYEEWVCLSLVLFAHFVSTYALILSPEIPHRVLFGPSVLLSVVFLSLFTEVLRYAQAQSVLHIIIGVLVSITIYSYGFVVSDNMQSHKEVAYQYRLIKEAKDRGQTRVAVPRLSKPRTLYNAYNGTANLGEGGGDWFNRWMAKYFDMEEISGLR